MIKKFLSSQKWKRSSLATLFVVLFIALLVVINVVVSVLSARFPSMNIDLTAAGLNTLSEDAVNVAKDTSVKTTIYIVGSEESIRQDQVYSNYGLK